jgi:aryl-alcohol dehydrogenase-like predicted oxidoreductase
VGADRVLAADARARESRALLDLPTSVGDVAERLGVTTAQVTIAWVLRQAGVSAAIVGSRSGRHMHDNAAAAELDLTDVIGELDQIVARGAA